MGPFVPIWFRKRLRQLDPSWVLQYIPPASDTLLEGVDPLQFPNGCWDICVRIKGTDFLHPRAVWSLSDSEGNYAPPGPDTVKMLQVAKDLHAKGQMERMEQLCADTIRGVNNARERDAREALQDVLYRYLGVVGSRQFSNRVYMRRDLKLGCSE